MSSKLADKIFEVYVAANRGFAMKYLNELGPSGAQAQAMAARSGRNKDPGHKQERENLNRGMEAQKKGEALANKNANKLKQLNKASKDKPVT